uniref:uncharacterized protein LOC122600981 n=1 Tax=Erigeron canadensis TaxID=72917 RepID=UPI001CB93F6E|nr:uncharacterized protein LOC122600981 [Erigeron canadensis]
MGNYMDTCIQREQTTEENPQVVQAEKEEYGKTRVGGGIIMESSSKMRVKLVLTKDELDWLLLQLKDKEGKSCLLEDVLGKIEKSRSMNNNGKSTTTTTIGGWKPSLESIMETPEVHHEMIRSSRS